MNIDLLDGRQVGVVDQEPVLFAGSIADNIRYGVPSATDEEVEEAARKVNYCMNQQSLIYRRVRMLKPNALAFWARHCTYDFTPLCVSAFFLYD